MGETLPDRAGDRHLAAKSATIRPMRLPRHAVSLMLMTALLAACGTPAPSASPSATASAAPETPTEPTPTETTPPTAGSPTPAPIADDPPPVALEVVADGLADPIGITSAPGG